MVTHRVVRHKQKASVTMKELAATIDGAPTWRSAAFAVRESNVYAPAGIVDNHRHIPRND